MEHEHTDLPAKAGTAMRRIRTRSLMSMIAVMALLLVPVKFVCDLLALEGCR